MKRKWLFLPDIILLLLVCLTCERRELSHKPLDMSNEPIMLAKVNKNKTFNRSWEKEEIVWETLKDNITTRLFGLKAKVLED